MSARCRGYAGEEDTILPCVIGPVARLPHATLVELPRLDHWAAYLPSELVLPHVNTFLAAAS